MIPRGWREGRIRDTKGFPAMQIVDSRGSTRYIAEPPLAARFGRADVSICNFGRGGLQIEHDEPLQARRGTVSWSSARPQHSVDIGAEVVWSRLLPSTLEPGRYRYRSGMRLDPSGLGSVDVALQGLVGTGRARPDTQSLERKRQVLERKAAAIESQRFLRPVTLPPTEAAAHRILEAHGELEADPALRKQWDALGWASLAKEPLLRQRYPEALAIWEMLDHEFDLETVARILKSSRQ